MPGNPVSVIVPPPPPPSGLGPGADPGRNRNADGSLRRGLKNRHIQLIALGGAIGTGLFLGSGGVIRLAGPAMILGYVIGGLIEFLIMRQLGEMIVEEPVAGSFSHFASKYWSGFAGFMSGWNYWVLYVLVGMTELTAVAKYIHYWAPDLPQWIPVLVFFVLINAVNLANVRIFGEAEFWFSIIKVLAVLGMIGFGGWLLLTGGGGGGGGGEEEAAAAVSNLWTHGGFFATDARRFAVALVIIMFSFGGLELVGVSAAETAEPHRTIPGAINQVMFRILIFYVGATGVMLMLMPWDVMAERVAAAGRAGDSYGASPFVLILGQHGVAGAAHLLNFVILTAALSVYNSGVYCNSRMLYGLALKGNAPRALLKVDRRGVPVPALAVSALATGLGVLVNYTIPEKALGYLLALVVAALVLNWALISITHLYFRRAKNREAHVSRFPSRGAPWTNYLCLAFVAFILVVMVTLADMATQVLLIPLWLGLLRIGWMFRTKNAANG
ncbi:MAG: amino acid permease [Opitutaceae bacterium]|jgi:aromatic amino acid transport protein AroP|nr:amino acid permease [Opitutaceae bacterium]